MIASVHELTLQCQLIKNSTEQVGVHWELEMRRRRHLSPEPRLFINETSDKSLHSAFRASSPCRRADRNSSIQNKQHTQTKAPPEAGWKQATALKLKANALVIHLASDAFSA